MSKIWTTLPKKTPYTFSKFCVGVFLCLFALSFGFHVNAFAATLDTSHVEEIKRQWDYLDKLKAVQDKAIKKKSRRLLLEIQGHFYANAVAFEIDPKNSSALLLKILKKEDLKEAHPLNRFAASLYRNYNQLRVEVNPLKLKINQAGALFDSESNTLTLAYDNILELKNDSFVGHEIIHARLYHMEKIGKDHVFMGILKRQESEAPLEEETYQDEFSLDEVAAYYYQVLTLLHEVRRSPEILATAKRFLEIGSVLNNHLQSDEITQFAITYLHEPNSKNISFAKNKDYNIVSVHTHKYILELNFLLSKYNNEKVLIEKSLARLQELNWRSKIIAEVFKKALDAVNNGNIEQAANDLSESKDRVLKFNETIH